MNDSGQVAFTAQLFGSGVTIFNNQGFWLHNTSTNSTTLVARFGSRPPGLPIGTRYGEYFESLALNNAGAVAFVAGIEPVVEPVDTGAWTSAGGPLRLLAADGYPIPGASQRACAPRRCLLAAHERRRQTSFFTDFNDQTLWVDTPSQPLRRVASAGDTLPGVPGMQVESLGAGLIDQNGRVAFGARLTSTSNPTGISGLWSETSGTLQLVAADGGSVPGHPDSFESFNSAQMNASGQLVFEAFMTNDSRLIAAQRPDGSLRVVAQTDQTLPGHSHTLINLYSPSINAAGHVAFPAYLAGFPSSPLPTSVWAENDTGLLLIAQAGQPAPGARGALFDRFEDIQFNDHGEVMFEAYLTEVAGITPDNDRGLWLLTRNGRLVLIAREGDYLDIAPGPAVNLQQVFTFDTVSSYPNMSAAERRMLSNRGEVLFQAVLYSGTSGLFLTGPIPEPSTLVLLSIAIIAALTRRRLK